MRGKRKVLDFFPVTTANSVFVDGTNKTIGEEVFANNGIKDKVDNLIKTTPKVIIINEQEGFDPEDISVTINNVINNNEDGVTLYLEEGKTYKLKSPIIFNKRQNLILNGTINPVVDMEYALLIDDPEAGFINSPKRLFINKLTTSNNVQKGIVLTNCYHMNLDLGYIFGFGSCLCLEPNKTNNAFDQGIQYCNFKFDQLRNTDDNGACILFNPGPSNLPWVNENTFIGGRVRGTNGFKSIKGTTQIDPFNNNKFYNIGFEALTGNGIDFDFGSNNSILNSRFENITGIFIKENSTCQFNKYESPQLIKKSKVDIKGNSTEVRINLTDEGGAVTSFLSIFNCYNNKNSVSIGVSTVDRGGEGISFCESSNDLLDRYALIFRSKTGEVFNLPCKEIKAKEVANQDFTMDYLYKDLRVISNEKAVTITIPNKFFYDSAEFNFITNWNTNNIVFQSEDGVEQFTITTEDGKGTWNVLFIASRGKFSPLKITDSFRQI